MEKHQSVSISNLKKGNEALAAVDKDSVQKLTKGTKDIITFVGKEIFKPTEVTATGTSNKDSGKLFYAKSAATDGGEVGF